MFGILKLQEQIMQGIPPKYQRLAMEGHTP